MSTTKLLTAAIGSFALSLAAAGCAPQQTAPPPAASMSSYAPPPANAPSTTAPTLHSGNPAEHHVYRLDFVLTTTEGANTQSTSFTLNLSEYDKGEVHVGKNVALSTSNGTGTAGSGGTSGGSVRMDVGTKVAASFRSVGDDILLDVAVEMSAFDPPTTIRKVTEKGGAIAPAGKTTLVTSLDDDHKHYQLTVTPTKLR
jgi:hypothetical protein